MIVIIANSISFLASFVQVGSGALKKRSHILIAQMIQLFMQTVSLFLTGGITGGLSNIISCLRNYLCNKDKLTKWWKGIIIALYIGVTFLFNSQGWVGWLPAAVCSLYILFMDVKDPIKFKMILTASFIPWIIYNFSTQLYVAGLVDGITVIINVVTLCVMIKEKRTKQ